MCFRKKTCMFTFFTHYKNIYIISGIRGGVSQCSKRYAAANNKFMPNFDASKKSTYIMYLDCNNLYGFTMMQSLPVNGFQWINNPHFTVEQILNIADDAPQGYIFEVDMEYPENLHDLHNDFPFCAENMMPPHSSSKDKKLLLTLGDKKNYVIHYRLLKKALSHGLVLKKIHTALKFNQSAWLKKYIELNTKERSRPDCSEFEKELYKLMNNAIFGKSMENVRNRMDLLLRSRWEGRYGVRNLVASPFFKRRTIFNENLVAVEMSKSQIVMDKPIAIGLAVLDISKTVMYEFYYEHLKVNYGNKVQMMYTDTDSFILNVECDNFYLDMMKYISKYDTSDFVENNVYGVLQANKKIPGLFKDELKGELVLEFVGLRSKMYSIRTLIDEKKRAKGVKKCVLASEIKFDDYVNCLKNTSLVIKKFQNTFQTKLHQMYTVRQEKVALSSLDDKRHILYCEARSNNIECNSTHCMACKHETLAHGHYRLKRPSHIEHVNEPPRRRTLPFGEGTSTGTWT